ncbi:hypothetical protein AJ85_21220 [Alkalihalobacillus alcalophilus ATCC 27647 = CGMCC 1.3604]|uniref:NAD(FAD)-dependent dehydrogenase n=1 Tax=Alkalihalobacillus alcalophilus ATCC 27647 = CGMCC 1.3604 TaxID=1218173 RepID=A0A094WQT5_ALKAL|nr:DUF2768 domain-containing protein [Alkalihalobacillus alcalophilus]KGA99156.1 hypothetical protein BALCAV_0200430 [Alkalihalobacillus alcalophilus ATCC 27647 = CGMCC 1.3604]MED1560503.1 DUF2768 domain-containing protein [Alkalihalobacillus alcalophilus]THG92042.1 hypothetical protein AJ85_21220 [Alkalihalobacillus alcalophilus ATCC 27647 = CGMCC 1.3604]
MSQAMLSMYVSFFAMFLMFVSVVTALISRTKLKGFLQKVVLTISFICLCVAGLIVFIVVAGGPTAVAN